MQSPVVQSTASVGEIVAEYPNTSNLFKEYRIDFCCGGGRPLSEVLAESGLDEPAFLERLNAIVEASNRTPRTDIDWRTYESGQLMRHIQDTHHAFLRSELPVLHEFVTKIKNVHGLRHPELVELHTLYTSMRAELEEHLVQEEERVFPLILEYERTGEEALKRRAGETIAVLEADHSRVGEILREMRRVTADYTLPEGACRTYTVSFQKLVQLESDLFEHIHLENNILFPRFEEHCSCGEEKGGMGQ
ncbi:putative ScdA [Paenibacillus mucilaginosus 3016]|uniref:Putative ScdA n=1 Tax=Paenibacillus mucilaginosus 3016 TaxID=1116391 RepID=H6NB42_9BACL|nr:iron-sulfur cluster repair di-iron protein [Paenibacillus mucilaginosus]AFC31297.1 putative ScdA [Paenibacillus mucilaginosus 3016]WFA19864.1 iron-sulfur cluster repair di-iron protein [Paenibacillus mucilaginosus]